MLSKIEKWGPPLGDRGETSCHQLSLAELEREQSESYLRLSSTVPITNFSFTFAPRKAGFPGNPAVYPHLSHRRALVFTLLLQAAAVLKCDIRFLSNPLKIFIVRDLCRFCSLSQD